MCVGVPVDKVLTEGLRRFGNRSEAFYHKTSVLHKSVREWSPQKSRCGALLVIANTGLVTVTPFMSQGAFYKWQVEDIGNAQTLAYYKALP